MGSKLDKSEKFEKRRQAWEKVRKQGGLRFILFRGVLGWGVSMIIMGACVDTFIDHKHLSVHPVRSLFLLLAGSILGLLWWADGERRFHYATKQQDSINKS
jgi:hypothetical protein